ncbi:hypothetical protein SNEBB_011401, partial [Seison nebaliae]
KKMFIYHFFLGILSGAIGTCIVLLLVYRRITSNLNSMRISEEFEENDELKFELPDRVKRTIDRRHEDTLQAINVFQSFLLQEMKDTIEFRRMIMRKLFTQFEDILNFGKIGLALHDLTIADFRMDASTIDIGDIRLGQCDIDRHTQRIDSTEMFIDINYDDGFVLTVKADVVVLGTVTIRCKAKHLSGVVRLEFSRIPFNNWSFCFLKRPNIDLEVQTYVGKRKINRLAETVKRQIIKHIAQKNVFPNVRMRTKPFFPAKQLNEKYEPLILGGVDVIKGDIRLKIHEIDRLPELNLDEDIQFYFTISLDQRPMLEYIRWRDNDFPTLLLEVVRIGTIQRVGIDLVARKVLNEKEIVVHDIYHESPCYRAGVEKYDILIAINNIPVEKDAGQVYRRLNQCVDHFSLIVQRPPKELFVHDDNFTTLPSFGDRNEQDRSRRLANRTTTVARSVLQTISSKFRSAHHSESTLDDTNSNNSNMRTEEENNESSSEDLGGDLYHDDFCLLSNNYPLESIPENESNELNDESSNELEKETINENISLLNEEEIDENNSARTTNRVRSAKPYSPKIQYPAKFQTRTNLYTYEGRHMVKIDETFESNISKHRYLNILLWAREVDEGKRSTKINRKYEKRMNKSEELIRIDIGVAHKYDHLLGVTSIPTNEIMLQCLTTSRHDAIITKNILPVDISSSQDDRKISKAFHRHHYRAKFEPMGYNKALANGYLTFHLYHTFQSTCSSNQPFRRVRTRMEMKDDMTSVFTPSPFENTQSDSHIDINHASLLKDARRYVTDEFIRVREKDLEAKKKVSKRQFKSAIDKNKAAFTRKPSAILSKVQLHKGGNSHHFQIAHVPRDHHRCSFCEKKFWSRMAKICVKCNIYIHSRCEQACLTSTVCTEGNDYWNSDVLEDEDDDHPIEDGESRDNSSQNNNCEIVHDLEVEEGGEEESSDREESKEDELNETIIPTEKHVDQSSLINSSSILPSELRNRFTSNVTNLLSNNDDRQQNNTIWPIRRDDFRRRIDNFTGKSVNAISKWRNSRLQPKRNDLMEKAENILQDFKLDHKTRRSDIVNNNTNHHHIVENNNKKDSIETFKSNSTKSANVPNQTPMEESISLPNSLKLKKEETNHVQLSTSLPSSLTREEMSIINSSLTTVATSTPSNELPITIPITEASSTTSTIDEHKIFEKKKNFDTIEEQIFIEHNL